MIEVGDDVTPIDPRWEGGYEDVKISKRDRRYYFVHVDTRY